VVVEESEEVEESELEALDFFAPPPLDEVPEV
jgi:hypothetical protein